MKDLVSTLVQAGTTVKNQRRYLDLTPPRAGAAANYFFANAAAPCQNCPLVSAPVVAGVRTGRPAGFRVAVFFFDCARRHAGRRGVGLLPPSPANIAAERRSDSSALQVDRQRFSGGFDLRARFNCVGRIVPSMPAAASRHRKTPPLLPVRI